MPIDRRGTVRGPDLNPVERNYAADDPDRAVGAPGDAVARVGYQTLDRANPRSFFDKERQGTFEPVTGDGADVPWNERTIGRGVY